MLPVSREVLLKELETAGQYIEKWRTRVEEGLPGIDVPATGDAEQGLETFLREMCGELQIVSGKCTTLSEVLLDSFLDR